MRVRLFHAIGVLGIVSAVGGSACSEVTGVDPDDLSRLEPPLRTEVVARLLDSGDEHNFEVSDPTWTGGPEPLFVTRVSFGMIYREAGARYVVIPVTEIVPGDTVELWTIPDGNRGGGPSLTYMVRVGPE